MGDGPSARATQREDRPRLWQAQHDAHRASFTLCPGAKIISTDLGVPISRLADISTSGLLAPIVGHVGDGNFPLGLLFADADAGEMARVDAFLDRLVRRAPTWTGRVPASTGWGRGRRGPC